jgi:hypothetical protein
MPTQIGDKMQRCLERLKKQDYQDNAKERAGGSRAVSSAACQRPC